MTRIKHLAYYHAAALVVALLASVITAAPQVAFRWEHSATGVYQGIEMLPDSPWTPRFREIQDGHGFGSIYYKDGKEDPYMFQPLGSMVVAHMGSALSLDVNDTILLSRVVLPFVVFLLLYAFVYLVAQRRAVALAAASLVLLGDGLLSGSGIMSLLQGVTPADFIRIARPVNPAMIYVFFFGFLIAFWKFFYRGLDWRWGAVAAVLLGLNFYNYFYTWTYLFAFGGFLGLLLLYHKEWRKAWSVAAVYGGALVLAVPWAVNIYQGSLYPTYEGVGYRLGITYTHEPLFIGLTSLAAIIGFIVLYPREDRVKYFFGLALMLAPIVTMNQQVITGRIMQADHYHWFFHKPMAVVYALILLFVVLRRFSFERYGRWVAAVLVAASVCVGAFMQYDSYKHERGEGGAVAVERQKYGPVMHWLNEHAQKDEVVLATDMLSHVTTIYTPLNVFFHRAGYISLAASEERLLDQLFTFFRLRGVTAKDADAVFLKERKEVSTRIEGIYYRKLTGAYESIPDERVLEIAALYKETLKTPTAKWLESILQKYEVSYVLWDKKADPLWRLERFAFLRPAATFGDITIYTYGKTVR